MRHRTLLPLLLLTAGCPALDVGQPIELVPRGWGATDIQVLRQSAACWNLQYGTRLVVQDDVDWPQQVQVAFSDFVCVYAAGQTNPTLPVTVHLCPPERYVGVLGNYRERLLFEVVLHELGHVLNIRRHAADPLAVMASGAQKKSLDQMVLAGFAPQDHELFHDANPDVTLHPTCDGVVVDRLADVPSCSCPHY